MVAKRLRNTFRFGIIIPMFTQAFPRFEDSAFIKTIRWFYDSPCYPALIALLMACSELFGLELACFYVYLFFGIVGLFCCEDARCIVPIACCSYMTISAANNPGKATETIFTQSSFLLNFVFILGIAAVILIGRLVLSLIVAPPKRKVPRLAVGFLFLGLAYVLGGAFTADYSSRSVIFGLIQIVSLCVFYFYFYYTVDWQKAGKDYLPTVILAVGIGICMEIAAMYIHAGINSSFVRGMLYTGWGIYNNVGCIMAMCMPAAFYFGAKKKNGWLFSALGVVMFLFVLLTQSRGAWLFGSVVFLFCIAFVLIGAERKEKLKHVAVFLAVGAALLVLLIAFREKLGTLFESMLNKLFNEEGEFDPNDAGRFDIYKACWQTFLDNPYFGAGFYKTPGALLYKGNMYALWNIPEESFMPARAHNTIFQLLATGGIFAIIAYLFHRIETLVLWFRRPTAGKIFVALSVSALLLTSLLDCHFFNFGPGLLYGILLVYAEGEDDRVLAKKPPKRRSKKQK